jgi:hypothetical protein
MHALRAASLGAFAACFAAAVAAVAPLSASGSGRVTSGRYLHLADAAVAAARSRWWDARLGWYTERRAGDPEPQEATLWAVFPLFEAVSWTAIGGGHVRAESDHVLEPRCGRVLLLAGVGT